MFNSINKLTVDDQVFVTLEVDGNILASVYRKDFGSIDDVVRFMRSIVGSFAGLAKLTIRNKTQGWSRVMMLASFRPRSERHALGSRHAMQLSLAL